MAQFAPDESGGHNRPHMPFQCLPASIINSLISKLDFAEKGPVMDLGIKGKRALVLASSKGLGHGIAVALAREGANVLLCGRSGEVLEANCAAINAEGLGKADWIWADLTDENFVATVGKGVRQNRLQWTVPATERIGRIRP